MRKTIYLFALCLFFTFPISLHAQWTKTNGLPGGSTTTLISFGDTLLANVGNGRYFYKNQELYFSTNHGKAWFPIVNPAFTQIYPVCTDGSNIFGYAYNLSEQRYVHYITGDFFQTLSPIHIPNSMDLRDFFLAYGHIYATRYDDFGFDLYRTNNDGLSWEFVSATSPNDVQFDGQYITGTNYTYIVRSDDQGFTWDTLLNYAGQQVSSLIQHDNHLLVFIFKPEDGCYTSDNNGQTWQYYPNSTLSQFYRYIWHDDQVYGLDGDKMIRSPDYGQTWEAAPLPPNSAYPAFQGISSGNALIIGGIQSMGSCGMYRSIDHGVIWKPITFDLAGSSGKLYKFSHDLYVPSPGGLYQNMPDGVNWTCLNLNIPHAPNAYWTISDFVKPGSNWLISDGSIPWVSVDGGVVWNKSNISQSNLPWDPAVITDFEVVKGNVVAWGNGSESYQYYISHDKGISFEKLDRVITPQTQPYIRTLDISGGKVYAIAGDQKIYRSDDGGNTWALHSGTAPLDSLFPCWFDEHSLLVRGDIMIVSTARDCYDKEMLFSKDNGQNWTYYNLATAGFLWGNSNIADLMYAGNYLVAATENGIYFSENDGIDWQDWNDGLHSNNIFDIETRNGFLWASTVGGGIWKRPISQLGISPLPINREINADWGHDLLQNALTISPNPASQLVQIETGSANGEIRILDAMGRIVLQQSVNVPNTAISVEAFPPGVYQVIFTCEKGIHLCSLVVQR